jgi:hypothetical protein
MKEFSISLPEGKHGECFTRRHYEDQGGLVEQLDRDGDKFLINNRFFSKPDQLIRNFGMLFFAETKSKMGPSWRRLRGVWQSGIDISDADGYKRVEDHFQRVILVHLIHTCAQTCARDVKAGAPKECPTGMWTIPASTPFEHVDTQNFGERMGYWDLSQCTFISPYPRPEVYIWPTKRPQTDQEVVAILAALCTSI